MEKKIKKKNFQFLEVQKKIKLGKILSKMLKKSKITMKKYLNKWQINVTFHPKRFQEFEHYLNIQCEEKVKNNSSIFFFFYYY